MQYNCTQVSKESQSHSDNPSSKSRACSPIESTTNWTCTAGVPWQDWLGGGHTYACATNTYLPPVYRGTNMSNTTLTPGLHWAHPIVLYVHMYVCYNVITLLVQSLHHHPCAVPYLSQQIYICTLVDCKEWTTYNYHTSVARIVQNLRICKWEFRRICWQASKQTLPTCNCKANITSSIECGQMFA